MKRGSIVKVGAGDIYFMAVITEISENKAKLKDLTGGEITCLLDYVEEATAEDMADELRAIYGFYN